MPTLPDTTETTALALDAAALLAVPPGRPDRLFPVEPAAAKTTWRALARRWHPDANPDPAAGRVFAHLARLYAATREPRFCAESSGPGSATMTAVTGRRYRLRWRRRHTFELGDMLIGRGTLTFRLAAQHADLAAAGDRSIAGLRFADARMERQMRPLLPSVRAWFATETHKVAVLGKPADLVLLRDLVDHLAAGGTPLDARHVAWIVSGLSAIACWLAWSGLSHNAIGPDTVFVAPASHRVVLLGGWWYAARFGQPLAALPAHTLDRGPADLAARKVASRRTDGELIRALGRDLLGDPAGTRLLSCGRCPEPMARFLVLPASGDAIADYAAWDQTLSDSFGARRFAELPVRPSDIYPLED